MLEKVRVSNKKAVLEGTSFNFDPREECFPYDTFEWKTLLKLAGRVSPILQKILFYTRSVGGKIEHSDNKFVIRMRYSCPAPCKRSADMDVSRYPCYFVTPQEYDAWREKNLTFYAPILKKMLIDVRRDWHDYALPQEVEPVLTRRMSFEYEDKEYQLKQVYSWSEMGSTGFREGSGNYSEQGSVRKKYYGGDNAVAEDPAQLQGRKKARRGILRGRKTGFNRGY